MLKLVRRLSMPGGVTDSMWQKNTVSHTGFMELLTSRAQARIHEKPGFSLVIFS